MTEQNHHDPAELDKLAEKFTVLPNDNPASDAKRAELIDKPAFGQVFSDNMAHMTGPRVKAGRTAASSRTRR